MKKELNGKKEAKRPLELYIHIPFCIKKCLYCDFLSFRAERNRKEQYVEKLAEEIEAMGASLKGPEHNPGYSVSSIFIGGGTPSILEPEQISRIFAALRSNFDIEDEIEITMEANPGTTEKKKLEHYKKEGINRLSLGLQSANDVELKVLGRIHTFREFLESYESARMAGFENINIDLMSALPGQTLYSYTETLETVVGLLPEHISAYSLIIEEDTAFYKQYGTFTQETLFPLLPDEDTEREMYHITKSLLKENGYERYEISNYARKGRECSHNIGYWTGCDYLGIGLGAASYLKGERFSNERDIKEYLSYDYKSFLNRMHHRERKMLSEKEKMEEMMFLGLRLSKGVGEQEFFNRFGKSMDSMYRSVLLRLSKQGLLEQYKPSNAPSVYWRLTEYGTDVSNCVMSEFLLD